MGENMKSQQKDNPERDGNGRKSRDEEKARVSRKTRGKQAPSGRNQETNTETKFRSVQNTRNAKVFANRTTKSSLKREKMQGSKAENILERRGRNFRARKSEKNRVGGPILKHP